MNILLTNDDGYNSEGILILKEKLQKYGNVIIVAPLNHMSAKSVSITLYQGYEVQKMGEDTFVIDGTPADCVSFGLNALDIQFDLVISGCNSGFNLSYDTLYSGTVGAALEALTRQVPSIAFSCNFNFEIVRNHFDKVLKYILDNDLLSTEYLLNVNFPNGEEVEGIKLSSLYYCKHTPYFTKENGKYYVHRHMQVDFSDEPESDCYLVNHGFVSITPLSKTCFHNSVLEDIKKKHNIK